MANQQLVDYLISLQTTKHSKTQVKRVLLEVGWHEHDVNEAFRVAELHGISHPRFSQAETSTLIQLFAVLLVILTGSFLIFGGEPTTTGQVILDVLPVETLPQPPSPGVIVFEEPQPQIVPIETPLTTIQTLPSAPAAPVPAPKSQSAPELPTKIAPKNCDSLSGFARDNCFTEQATQKNDERICSRIREPVRHSLCIQEIAVKKKEKVLCNSTSNADLCYDGYAKTLSDPSACSRITNSQNRQQCLLALKEVPF